MGETYAAAGVSIEAGDEAVRRIAPLARSTFRPEVLADIAANAPRSPPPTSSFPPPLGQSEGHDAWTVDRMSRQITVPPVRSVSPATAAIRA